MPDELFADVPSEGNKLDIDKAFDRLGAKESNTPSDSQAETKEVQQPSQEGENTSAEKPEPFHKHPRWIKTQAELKETRDKLAKLESERAQGQPVSLPDWWKNQYGDTQESKERYEAVLKGELPWLEERILTKLEEKQKAETLQSQQGEEYVETQLAEMAEEGLKFERNKLLKFMVDFQEEYGSGALLDADGNYDFRKSFKLMEKLQPEEAPSKDLQKQLASQSGRAKGATSANPGIPVVDSKKLRRGNWRDAGTGQFVSR